MPTRRAWLQTATVMLAWPGAALARSRTLVLAAAWDDPEGRHHVGVLGTDAGTTGRLTVRHALEVPTRAHAILPCLDGDLVAVARRPGAWMVRWRPGQAAHRARWRWSEPDRSFNGHIVSAGGASLLSTETDAASGVGLLVRRDALTLARLEEWPTHGIDPHAVLALPDGCWLVANGGVPTQPERGRAKAASGHIDASLVRLDPQGRLAGQWRLEDQALSLRHLARHPDGTVGVALQAEHEDAQERRLAPLLALWNGSGLRTAEAGPWEGYAGDIVTELGGFALSATRAGQVVQFDLTGQQLARHALNKACALSPTGSGGWLAAGPDQALHGHTLPQAHRLAAPGLRLDNHWAVLSG